MSEAGGVVRWLRVWDLAGLGSTIRWPCAACMGRAACCWPVQLTMFSASLLAPSIICSSWMVLAAAGAVCSHGRACACCASGSCSRANTRSSIGLLRAELGRLAASSRSIASGTRTTCRICVVMGAGGGAK